MQIQFFLLQCGNQRLDQRDTLPRLLGAVHEKSVVAMLLEFWRFLTERASNAFTELRLYPSPGRIEIRKAFSAKIFHLCEEFMELSGATGELFDRGSFRPRARRF
ncbi:MAG TPA: hypothetical protein VLL94_14755 [Nitrospiraceae bacterium]|nr:hypothetical protein [Nitrospiraceae bacterium]